MFGGLGVTVIVALTTILANRRLQSLVRQRTQELAISEQRQREYFELAPAPIIIEDYTAYEPVLAQYRREGITDLRVHLQERPVIVRDLLRTQADHCRPTAWPWCVLEATPRWRNSTATPPR